jgi:hypothetical protein
MHSLLPAYRSYAQGARPVRPCYGLPRRASIAGGNSAAWLWRFCPHAFSSRTATRRTEAWGGRPSRRPQTVTPVRDNVRSLPRSSPRRGRALKTPLGPSEPRAAAGRPALPYSRRHESVSRAGRQSACRLPNLCRAWNSRSTDREPAALRSCRQRASDGLEPMSMRCSRKSGGTWRFRTGAARRVCAPTLVALHSYAGQG